LSSLGVPTLLYHIRYWL